MIEKRQSGVLLPVFSLMSRYGIGDFGSDADTFLDMIAAMGFSVWQVLPVTTIGLGDSPYSGVSAFAGNALFIDPDRIPDRLVTAEERNEAVYRGQPYRVDYPAVKAAKTRLLRRAYARITEADKAVIAAFCKENAFWLPDYALYMALKDANEGRAFTQWETGIKYRKPAAIRAAKKTYANEILYYMFEQYLFFSQWTALKARAGVRGVEIFGDMPIYVAEDSADVWANAHLFQLEKDFSKKASAGVPPDYFAADGQLWGNPLYNYEVMEQDGYRWWVERMKHNLKLYDILRIDHFRGLYRYWAVPAGAKTAKEGAWQEGPQMKLWQALKKEVKNPRIVAEDLGMIDEGVRSYLKKTGFPGMRVLQFAFDGSTQNVHLPFNYEPNTVAYTATHDNDTTLGWLFSLEREVREGVLDYLSVTTGWGEGGGNAPVPRAAVKEAIASVSRLAVVPFQDLSGYGSDTRINTPGVPEGNWNVRTTAAARDEVDASYFLYLNRKYGRTNR